ncbi:GntR family transcriptional regulator [Alicyclobacillus ferrooxydans]|uniref:HTH gntR-type domain-containing protein n=1 Tax=Alicyclobacillus ferrooxydans TaxID=471514 RepID=A0A0P9CQC0_9BACL|nr:GntR family transcriptional regulator [Alicyclobacillus ferrooxydans]KPV45092.1 hypothetical protein AN477_03620 [Alicyclobacillus ferrooxydans]
MAFREFPSLFEQPEFGQSLPVQISEQIARQIFEGEYVTGQRLKEEELAKVFHTSRAPVREALYLLQLEGLVERLPRRGTVVRAYEEKEVHELYDVRIGLECLAIDQLQKAWNDTCSQKFRRVLERMEVALSEANSDEYAELNDVFHQLLFELGKNQILWRIYHQLNNVFIILLQASTQEAHDMRTSYEEHKGIVDAMEVGDFVLAKERLVNNVTHGKDRALQAREQTSDGA